MDIVLAQSANFHHVEASYMPYRVCSRRQPALSGGNVPMQLDLVTRPSHWTSLLSGGLFPTNASRFMVAKFPPKSQSMSWESFGLVKKAPDFCKTGPDAPSWMWCTWGLWFFEGDSIVLPRYVHARNRFHPLPTKLIIAYFDRGSIINIKYNIYIYILYIRSIRYTILYNCHNKKIEETYKYTSSTAQGGGGSFKIGKL